jgi:hypothetical protein
MKHTLIYLCCKIKMDAAKPVKPKVKAEDVPMQPDLSMLYEYFKVS